MEVDYTINPKGTTKILKQTVIANRPTQNIKWNHGTIFKESERRRKKKKKEAERTKGTNKKTATKMTESQRKTVKLEILILFSP